MLRELAQQLLADESVSVSKLWGVLLTQGFQPEEINQTLTELQSNVGGSLLRNSSRQTAIARQAALLHNLSQKNNANIDLQISDRGVKLQEMLQLANVIVFADDAQLSWDLHRMLRDMGVARFRRVDINGEFPAEVIEKTLESSGSESAKIAICATGGGQNSVAESINRSSFKLKVPVLYYKLFGTQVQLGPLVIPGETACLECLRVRRQSHMAPWERSYCDSISDIGMLTTTLGVDWIAADLIKLITGVGEPISLGRLLFIDYFSGIPELHTLLRVPRCSVCGPKRKPQVRLWEEI